MFCIPVRGWPSPAPQDPIKALIFKFTVIGVAASCVVAIFNNYAASNTASNPAPAPARETPIGATINFSNKLKNLALTVASTVASYGILFVAAASIMGIYASMNRR